MSLTTSLRRAAKLQEKIAGLRAQLTRLLDQARAELAASPIDEINLGPRRGARSQQRTKIDGRTKAGRAFKGRRHSPLRGIKRAASPSGPLAPAVVKVLAGKKRPMNVRDILGRLLAGGYQFNAAEPKKNLAARIYRLSGVKQVSPGLFAAA